MASSEDSSRNDAPGSAPGGVASANPAALTVGQLARLLGISEQKVRRHLADGAPAGPGGAINLIHYTAWLNRQLRQRDGD